MNRSAALFAMATTAILGQAGLAHAGQFHAGARVEGHIGSNWSPCTVIGEQRPTGGYLLRCDALPAPENIFSESDVRQSGGAQAGPAAPAPMPRAMPVAAPAAIQGRAVQGRFGSNWIDCVQLGAQLLTGGYRLHCPSLPDDENVFSATDVRQVGAATTAPAPQPVALPQGRAVQGHVRDHWEACVMVGGQLATGGYVLRCASTPNQESVFSATDVRF